MILVFYVFMQVTIKIKGPKEMKKSTNFIRKNLNPVWNEQLIFPHVKDSQLSLVVTVEDHNDIKPTRDFM